jgi:hypothetical protein
MRQLNVMRGRLSDTSAATHRWANHDSGKFGPKPIWEEEEIRVTASGAR